MCVGFDAGEGKKVVLCVSLLCGISKYMSYYYYIINTSVLHVETLFNYILILGVVL